MTTDDPVTHVTAGVGTIFGGRLEETERPDTGSFFGCRVIPAEPDGPPVVIGELRSVVVVHPVENSGDPQIH